MDKRICHHCWYELMSENVEGAKAFYGAVLGWTASDMESPGGTYTVMSAGDRGVSGILPMPAHVQESGAKPMWLGYVAVGDADAAAAAIEADGGQIHRAPADIPEVGRFAVVADPQGAIFQIMQPFPTEVPPPLPAGTAGTIGWHELYATSAREALDFYGRQFGWTETGQVPMGTMGVYRLWAAGGQPVGGMMDLPPNIPRPMWIYYFWVQGIDAAVDRVEGGGGRIVHGPMEVPGPAWVVQAIDPEGALFGLVSTGR